MSNESAISKIIELRFMRIRISTSLMLGEGGRVALIVGMNETKAKTNTATVANRLLSYFSWKNTNKPITLKIQIGMKTVRIIPVGN